MAPIDGAKASGAAPRPSRASRITRRRSSGVRQRRAPYQSPPANDPSDHAAMSGPTALRSPSRSAKAGSATSSAPNEIAVIAPTRTSVRMPGDRSAPARVRSTCLSPCAARATGAVANPTAATT